MAAYGVVAGIVFVGRELDLLHELLFGIGVAAIDNPFADFAGQTIANILVGAVWPSFLYATLSHTWFAGVIAGYLAVVAWLYLTDRRHSSYPSQRDAGPVR